MASQNTSSNRSSAPEIFSGIFILVCSSIPYFGFDKVFSTNGFMGIFWQAFIASVAIAVGVPLAMRVNRENREAEKWEVLREFCLMFHYQLKDNIQTIDNSTIDLVSNLKPNSSPKLDYFEQPEWYKRWSIVDDSSLVSRLESVKWKLEYYLNWLNRTKSAGVKSGFALHMLVQHSIGYERHKVLTEIYERGEMSMEEFYTNDGLNSDLISMIGCLEDFMLSKNIAFQKWNPERVRAVIESTPATSTRHPNRPSSPSASPLV